MDIRFYTLDFSDMRILPETSKYNGYTSMNAEIEFRGNGKFELVFYDDEIEQFVREHPEGLLITWGKFQGYLTDYQFKEKEKWLFGSHINSLLHKFLICLPDQRVGNTVDRDGNTDAIAPKKIDGDLQAAVKDIITTYTPFVFVENEEKFGDIVFSLEDMTYCDTFIKELTEKAKIGYKLYIKDKVVYFELLKPVNNPLMLSKNNNNVYETQEDFSNKDMIYSGWYMKYIGDNWNYEPPRPQYEPTLITLDGKTGLLRQDVELNAIYEEDATEEIKRYKTNYDITCKTRNIEFDVDYKLGDILRYQTKHTTVLKQVSKISLWHEKNTYHEEPNLIEWEG